MKQILGKSVVQGPCQVVFSARFASKLPEWIHPFVDRGSIGSGHCADHSHQIRPGHGAKVKDFPFLSLILIVRSTTPVPLISGWYDDACVRGGWIGWAGPSNSVSLVVVAMRLECLSI